MNNSSNKLRRASTILAVIFIALSAYLLGRYQSMQLSPEHSKSDALQMEALTVANQVDGAISALSLMEQGDLSSAKIILESQVTSGMTVLIKLTGNNSDEPVLVKQVIDRGKQYAKQHNLNVLEPFATQQKTKE